MFATASEQQRVCSRGFALRIYSPDPPLVQASRGDVLSCMADMNTHTRCGELPFCPALGLLAVATVARGELLTHSTQHTHQIATNRSQEGRACCNRTAAPACDITNNGRLLASAPASPEASQRPQTQVRPRVEHLHCCFCSASTTTGHIHTAQVRRRPSEEALEGGSTPKACAEADEASGRSSMPWPQPPPTPPPSPPPPTSQ